MRAALFTVYKNTRTYGCKIYTVYYREQKGNELDDGYEMARYTSYGAM